MNKKILAIVIVIFLAVGGGITYLLLTDDAEQAMTQMTEVDQATTQEVAPAPETEPTAATPGAYVDYSSDVIANTPGTKILFFHAPWCPQCRDLDADIKKNGVPPGVTIIKIDYDTNQALRQKYGVTLQTTLVEVDDNGNLVEKFVAYDDPSLKAVVENLL